MSVIHDNEGKGIGKENPLPVLLAGSVLVETQTNVDAVSGVLTFTNNISYIEILNRDATNDGTFTINGIEIFVPKASKFSRVGVAGTVGKTVTVAGSLSYVVNQYV
jgi:hypothetical protein